ncbi:TetR/AcrR family transcriptional regulator [Dethiothermospora halolimnae]|uniref:TetR/AcrR family transcriptional regulator n=1 Tax=Dethiothermospora halolimnae TaxID=3114390 RepID=UPI003CCC17E2
MEKKQIIRESAVKVIAERGYHNTTIKMIANDANISVGTIYNYFKNKDEIIDYIFEVEHEKRIKFLNEINEDQKDISQKIELFLDFHFNDLMENRNVGKVLIQESMIPNDRPIEHIQKFLNELPIIFSNMLKKAKENDEIREVNCEIISNVIFHAIRGVVYTLEAKENNSNYKTAKKEIFEFILNGIKK